MLSEGGGIHTLIYNGLAPDMKTAGRLALQAGVDVGISYESGYMLDLIASVAEGGVPMNSWTVPCAGYCARNSGWDCSKGRPSAWTAPSPRSTIPAIRTWPSRRLARESSCSKTKAGFFRSNGTGSGPSRS